MQEYNKENLTRLMQNFCFEENENPDKQIKKLHELEKLPKDEAINILNFLITQEKNPDVLFYIVKKIGKYNDQSSITGLIELLLFKKDHREDLKNLEDYLKVRCLASSILGNLKNENAVIPLLYILNNKDESYKLRLSSAEALGKIGDKYAVIPLIDIVSNEEEKSVYLRESAASALGMLNDIRAIEPFIKILETKKGIVDKFTFLREKIIEALGRIGSRDEKILKTLSNALSDESPCIRLSAIETLTELNDDKSLKLIEQMLNDEEEDVARCAVNALYNIAGKNYIVELMEKPDLSGWCKDEIETILEEEEDNDEK